MKLVPKDYLLYTFTSSGKVREYDPCSQVKINIFVQHEEPKFYHVIVEQNGANGTLQKSSNDEVVPLTGRSPWHFT